MQNCRTSTHIRTAPNLLEMFAGSRSVGKVAERYGYNVFSTDLKPFERIDLAQDVLTLDVKDIPFVPDVIWASPPCTFFSVASIGHHWNADHTPKTEEALVGVSYRRKDAFHHPAFSRAKS